MANAPGAKPGTLPDTVPGSGRDGCAAGGGATAAEVDAGASDLEQAIEQAIKTVRV